MTLEPSMENVSMQTKLLINGRFVSGEGPELTSRCENWIETQQQRISGQGPCAKRLNTEQA